MVKYLYEVHPVRPVVSPTDGRLTRRPFSAEFTSEQVRDMMPKARVFRRFPDHDGIVPVTGQNRESLHRPRYYIESVEPKKTGDPVAIIPEFAQMPPETFEAAEEPVEEVADATETTDEVSETVEEPVVQDEVAEEENNKIVEEIPTEEEPVKEEETEVAAVEEDTAESADNVEESEVSEEVMENEEEEANSEEATTQDTEKKASETPGYVVNSNKNKYHKSHKRH